MFNFKNKEKGEVLLVKLNHILLKEGDNELDLTPRRMNIAKEEIEKRKLVIVNGVIATIFSIILYNNFTSFLSFLSAFIPSLGAIIIADYFFVQKSAYKEDFMKKSFKAINPIAFLAFIIGTIFSIIQC